MANPLVWYIGASTSIVCGRGDRAPPDGERRRGRARPGAGDLDEDDLRRAGRAAAADAVGLGRRATSGSGSASSSLGGREPVAVVARPGRRGRRPRRAPARSSQSGRSQRTGTGTAPSFQAANTPATNSGELPRRSDTRSPRPTPRAARACAIWVERRSRSAHVTSVSVPSRRANTRAGSVGVRRRQLDEPLRRRRSAPRGWPRSGARSYLTHVSR